MSSLDDVKMTSQTDNNAAKTIALDHLGVIAARIRSSTIKVQRGGADSEAKLKTLKPLDDVCPVASLHLEFSHFSLRLFLQWTSRR